MSSRLTDTTGSLIQAALRLLDTKCRPAEHPHEADFALEQLILAARDLVCVVDGLAPDKQPARWSKRVPGSPGRTVSPETGGEDGPACSEAQGSCRYHQGYVDATASTAA